MTVETDPDETLSDKARMAENLCEAGMDDKSDYSVGAVIECENGKLLKGINIRLSGMEYTVHAEQLALFKLIFEKETPNSIDGYTPAKVVVVTSEHDLALSCGHCLQVFSGACNYYGWDASEIEYTAAARFGQYYDELSSYLDNWVIDRHTLDTLIGDTYVQTKSQ